MTQEFRNAQPWDRLGYIFHNHVLGLDDLTAGQKLRLARRIVADATGTRNHFLEAMRDRPHLTEAQVDTVLRIVEEGIERQSRRFWKSRDRRRDRHRGDANCMVCGGPLNDYDSTHRGIGPTCWANVLWKDR